MQQRDCCITHYLVLIVLHTILSPYTLFILISNSNRLYDRWLDWCLSRIWCDRWISPYNPPMDVPLQISLIDIPLQIWQFSYTNQLNYPVSQPHKLEYQPCFVSEWRPNHAGDRQLLRGIFCANSMKYLNNFYKTYLYYLFMYSFIDLSIYLIIFIYWFIYLFIHHLCFIYLFYLFIYIHIYLYIYYLFILLHYSKRLFFFFFWQVSGFCNAFRQVLLRILLSNMSVRLRATVV